MFSPLESFEINIYYKLKFITFIDHFFLFFLLILFLLFLTSLTRASYIVNGVQYLMLKTYSFFLGLFKSQITNRRAEKFFPLLFATFYFILFLNLFNLFVYNVVITGHIIMTLAISFTLFFAFFIIAFLNFQSDFFNFFIPKNVPPALTGLLIIIEVLSFFIRPFSLAIRLFANILAGHTLLHIFGSFFIYVLHFFPIFVIVPIILCFLITGLEVAVAFIQAYVFFVLLCVYLNDVYKLH